MVFDAVGMVSGTDGVYLVPADLFLVPTKCYLVSEECTDVGGVVTGTDGTVAMTGCTAPSSDGLLVEVFWDFPQL